MTKSPRRVINLIVFTAIVILIYEEVDLLNMIYKTQCICLVPSVQEGVKEYLSINGKRETVVHQGLFQGDEVVFSDILLLIILFEVATFVLTAVPSKRQNVQMPFLNSMKVPLFTGILSAEV